MKIFLSACDLLRDEYHKKHISELAKWNILASYVNMPSWQYQYIAKYKNFMLDSGAFSFMNSPKKIDWNEYVYNYCNFINKLNVKLYFELDIDNLIGLSEVEKLRNYINGHTKYKCIPVWHINRGKDYFINMCKNYPYVALGGLVQAGDKNRKKYDIYFKWFIKIAHLHDAKIHGLGYTSMQGLKKYHFDSVDSTTFLNGAKFGEIQIFENGTINKYHANNQKKLKFDYYHNTIHNFQEWIKFNNYAEKKL